MSLDFIASLASAAASTLSTSPLEAPVRALKNLAHRAPSDPPPPAGAPGKGAAGADDGPDLTDMTLPDDLKALIEPILGEFDMRLEVAEREEAPMIDKSKMHIAKNGETSIYLLHFDARVLENARRTQEVTLRGFLFRSGEIVRVLSKGCTDFDPAFLLTWQLWTKKQVQTYYVDWSRIRALARAGEGQRADLLHDAFRFPDTLQRHAPKVASTLPPFDAGAKQSLAQVIADLGQGAGKASVNAYILDLLSQAQLPKAMKQERAEWGTSYPEGARNVINWLEDKRGNPEQAGYSCLASFLVVCLPISGTAQREILIGAIERFALIASAAELAALKQLYPKV